MFEGLDEMLEGFLVWSLEGILVGYVMGFVVGEFNDDPSLIGDIGAGVVGALVGGLIGHYFVDGAVGFAVSMGTSALGATIVTGAWRSITGARTRVA